MDLFYSKLVILAIVSHFHQQLQKTLAYYGIHALRICYIYGTVPWSFWEIFDHAVKACRGQTIQLIWPGRQCRRKIVLQH
jgi:hypothetical protein